MRMCFLLTLFLFYWLLLPSPASASSVADGVKEGNRLYNQGKYDEAIEKYGEVKSEFPDSDIVNYNLGVAQYKKGNYQKAIKALTKALNTDNQNLEAKAIYNIANAKYKLGNLKANADLNSAIGLYRESLDYYKRAIELDENDQDAKYNHELVERRLKVLLDKLKNQKRQEKQDEGQDSKKTQDKKGSHTESIDERKEATQGELAGSKREYEENKAPGKQSGQKQDSRFYDKEIKRMSPEEAHMLLEAYGEEEASESIKQHKGGYYPEILKDW